jgi:serine/threonine-protein kinase
MAEVYAARVRGEAGFQKLVAVKRMLPQLADDDEFVTMFLDEARLAANINSPHCVQTLELGRHDDGSLYIVMELVVGVTLARILRHGATTRASVPIPIAVEIVAQAAEGLYDAHVATTPIGSPLHIVHRDVSPQNVLIGLDGRVRLTDFGVARAVLRSTQTVAGRIKGKFAYCSPEQLIGNDVDQRSDIFSLGIVAWEFLVGSRLFLGDHPMETMEKVRVMPVPTVQQIRPDVPAAISDVVGWALERDLEKRAPTARDFATNLRDALRVSGLQPASRDDIGRFVRASGGEALAKMRDNIKRALSSAERGIPDGASDTEPLLTPSGVKSGVSTVARASAAPDPTDPVTGTLSPAKPFPDASVPSAAALPAALITPAEPKRKSGVLWLLVAGALVTALGVGGAVGAVYVMTMEEPTSIELPMTATPTPELEPPPAAVIETPVDEQDQPPEEPPVEELADVRTEASDETTPEERPSARAGVSSMRRQTAMQPEMVTAVETPVMERGTMSTRMSGIVGLDLFDQGLQGNR